jgi:hypothetical protein
MLTQLYRKLIPLSFRTILYEAFVGQALYFFRNFRVIAKSRFIYWFNRMLPKTEENLAWRFMGKYGLTAYPYEYMLEYKNQDIHVVSDEVLGLPYVMHNNKRLYFQPGYNKNKIIKIYRELITEQDTRSSHRYVKSYDELKGKTLLDIGSAEGIFALDTVELSDHVYLFECDKLWIRPLEATFAPWHEKVSIIEKYISDKTEGTNMKLDDFLADKPKGNLFLKMDIEGAEKSALAGASETLKSAENIQLAICTYHVKDDPESISSMMASLGYSYEFTDGLMYWSRRLSKGLIRCFK